MKVRTLPIDRLIPYARNPRKSEAAVAKVAASLREFGWRQPIVVAPDMVVVVGHVRLAAARLLGMTEVPVHIADGLSSAQLQAYRLRTTERTKRRSGTTSCLPWSSVTSPMPGSICC